MHARFERPRAAAIVAVALLACAVPARPAIAAQSAHSMYTRALARERTLRDAARVPSLTALRTAIRAYESIVRRYPASAYCDNALWQAANLALLAYERYGDAADKRTGIRLVAALRREYPSSSLIARAGDVERQLNTVRSAAASAGDIPGRAAPAPRVPPPAAPPDDSREDAAGPDDTGAPGAPVTIREIRRTPIPDGVRVSIELDGESLYRQERLENPRRVFFDLRGAKPITALQDATLRFADDVVREIRLGRHPQQTTRVVMDMEGVESYSVFTLYNPFRLVVDFRRSATAAPAADAPVAAAEPRSTGTSGIPALRSVPLASRPAVPAPSMPPPGVPAANSNGQFSLARQLGLGIARVVIDAGHGGHDPGARANGINESELVLDVALRLQRLLEKQPNIEVTMTRDRDVFIPLEERTAIANRQGADLFLSIHANASRNTAARGVETYFLNFASNAEAAEVAARENATSGKTMHNLPDIVRAIALNNKINESRDFAQMVQSAMVKRLAARNRQLRDLGVKQAPFVVLIGAGMPSVLAEISFVTNKQEGALLKTGAYRQQIAEALLDAVIRYQKSLKRMTTIASKN